MWKFASNCLAGTKPKKDPQKKNESIEISDDEGSSISSKDEGLECPICWESFNIVENVPYVLWCGHTLCKNCILGLQCVVFKLPTLPLQLPLFISCPWCNVLSPRVVIRGNLRFPRKNFFLLWMIESKNGDRAKSHSTLCSDHQTMSHAYVSRGIYNHHSDPSNSNHNNIHRRINVSLRKSLVFFVHLTSKFPLVLIFLLIVMYVIPATAAVLVVYILITILFALPAFVILYFAYPSLDWLVREIID